MRARLLAGALALISGPVLAAPPLGAAGPAVSVTIGPALQARAADLGPRELDYLAKDLHDAVAKALTRAGPSGPVRVDLTLDDAVPNRPTMAQLARTPGLSFTSIGLGGARISGSLVYPDGSVRPLKDQFFETDLINDRGADTWFDAERAISEVAYDIRRGHFPDKFAGPGPSGSGHFGYPFTSR